VADVLYLFGIYWPYLAAILFAGVVVGWWAEGTRDDTEDGWLQAGDDAP
jgi:hypothetical protein